MTTDQSQSGEALELQLFDLVELARDSRSDKGGEAKWVHLRGDLVKEFAKRIAALAQSDAGPLRCLITGNPCGTDTWGKNSPCKCTNCQIWLAQSDRSGK